METPSATEANSSHTIKIMPDLDTPITPTVSTKIATLDPPGNATAAQILALATKSDVDLSEVDNTSDMDKPVST